MNKKYVETTNMLSRMYGVTETFHPWDYLENEKLVYKIKNWTEEFLRSENKDIVNFFEKQIIE